MTAQPRPADRDDRAPMTDGEHEAFVMALPPCPGLPSSDEELSMAIAEARADVAAGRVYPHALVKEWLSDWGKHSHRTFHDWLASRDG